MDPLLFSCTWAGGVRATRSRRHQQEGWHTCQDSSANYVHVHRFAQQCVWLCHSFLHACSPIIKRQMEYCRDHPDEISKMVSVQRKVGSSSRAASTSPHAKWGNNT